MWLAETAVSRSVLDLMAAEGIKFTILAPTSAPASASLRAAQRRCLPPSPRAADAPLNRTTVQCPPSNWILTPHATVNPTHPYLINLDEGRSIAVFFYDGPASRAIAFEGLLNSGEAFGARLLDGFHTKPLRKPPTLPRRHRRRKLRPPPQHGEMALSYAMHWIEDNGHAKLTNYGEFLEKFPPEWEAEVVEDTSWSCAHGVERWRSDCGCNGGKPGWNQHWRGPLREALDFLRDATAPLAEKLAAPLLTDLWAARDAYTSTRPRPLPELRAPFLSRVTPPTCFAQPSASPSSNSSNSSATPS